MKYYAANAGMTRVIPSESLEHLYVKASDVAELQKQLVNLRQNACGRRRSHGRQLVELIQKERAR